MVCGDRDAYSEYARVAPVSVWRLEPSDFYTHRGEVLGRILFSGLLVILAACATTEDPLDKAIRQQVAFENYANCQKAYANGRIAMTHNGHSHKNGKYSYADIRADLAMNQCRRVLGHYWVRQ